jgi:hypothetical protein
MSQRFIVRTKSIRTGALLAAALVLPLAGCAGGGAIQPDRSVFSLDGNYQRCQYGFPIEETFDRTVKVFKEAGYHLDVVDRATGQISGIRGNTGTNTSSTDKGLKFYALVLPTSTGVSQVGVKIVQIIEHGSVFNKSRTEIIVSDPQMYQYMFRRIADIDQSTGAYPPPPAPATSGTTGTGAKGTVWDNYGAQPYQQPKSYSAPR